MLWADATQDSGPGPHPGNSQVAANPSAGMTSTHQPSTTLCPDGGQRRPACSGGCMRAGCLSQSRAWGRCWAGRDLALHRTPPPTMLGSLSPEGGLGVEHLEPVLVGSGEGPFRRHGADRPHPAGPRYISLLPVIPVTLRLNPREALEGRHPQDGRSAWPPQRQGPGGLWEAGPRAPGVMPAHGDVTLYK